MITVKDLLSINIFTGFPPGTFEKIIPRIDQKTFSAGTMIIYRGDPGYSMFMILEGTIAITLKNDEGIEYTIDTLGEGEVFGEMALMTGEPRSANVKAITDVRLAELYQDAFFELIAAHPRLNESFLRMLVQRRARTSMRWQFANLEREEIIAKLNSQEPPEIDFLIGKTKWTNDFNAEIKRLASVEKNILIHGERGTGKNLAARLIQFHSQSQSWAIFNLDCANPPPIQREIKAKSKEKMDALHLEIAQETALFGHSYDAGGFARSIRRGFIELANGGAVILENIESLSARVQHLLTEYLREGTFVRKGETQRISSSVRLISTTSMSLQELEKQENLNPVLLTLISGEILHMKPLRDRKKDIPVIAKYFLHEYNHKFTKRITGFTEEALSDIVDHSWPLNIDELRQVIERAVAITEDNIITSSQVFLNTFLFSTEGRFNLLRIPLLRKLANHPMFPKGLHMVSVPLILVLILFTLFGPQEKNPANLIVWSVWWPVLIFSIIISARSWCGYCPLPVISDGINFNRQRFFTVPGFLERNGVWIGIAGFVLIFLTEHATHMFSMAHATGLLLLTILSGATITNFFLGKRSWCKHICPLGKMIAHCSALSLVEMGSNTNVCSSQCETHDCIKGRYCPMGLHPSVAAASKDCILCLSCAKRCIHQSVRIDLRTPWQGLRTPRKWDFAGAVFAVLLAALVLAVSLPSWGLLNPFLSKHLPDNPIVINVVVPVLITFVFTALAFLASGFPASPSWKNNFSVSGYAYLFLAFAGFFNIYFYELVYNGYNLLPWTVDLMGLSNVIPADWITPNLGMMKILIPLTTLIGSIIALFIIARLGEKYSVPLSVRRTQKAIILMTSLLYLFIL